MIYINKNNTINELQEIVNHNFENLPESFQAQQRNALELFKQRLFLEEVIEETTTFNKNLNWDNSNPNLYLTTTAEELLEVYKLRSDVFTKIGYQEEFTDTIEGLNFDKFDKKSAVIYYKNNNEITGTCRFIFDSKNKLPSEGKLNFDTFRKQYGKIGELSRNVVKNETKSLSLEFKYLMAGIYNIHTNNNIQFTISGIKKDHYKLCSKFGGIEVLEEMDGYGKVKMPFLLISWDLAKVSPFFKKAFLS